MTEVPLALILLVLLAAYFPPLFFALVVVVLAIVAVVVLVQIMKGLGSGAASLVQSVPSALRTFAFTLVAPVFGPRQVWKRARSSMARGDMSLPRAVFEMTFWTIINVSMGLGAWGGLILIAYMTTTM